MYRKNDRQSWGRRLLLQLGSVGMALAFTLGAPAASEVAPVPLAEVQAQMPDPFGQLQFGFWHIRVCLLTCYPEWALCCGQDADPLY